MAKTAKTGRQSTRGEPLPRWVIDHLIALCEFAESRKFTKFEAMLMDSTETLLKDINSKALLPAELVATSGQTGTNVLPFVAATRSS